MARHISSVARAPFAGMDRRLRVAHHGDQFVDDFGSRHGWRRKRMERPFVVAVDPETVGHRPDVGPLAGGDEDAEMIVVSDGLLGRRRRAIGPRILLLPFRLRRRAVQTAARRPIDRRIACMAEFADPIHPFIRVEMPVTAVGERGACARREMHQRLIGALGRPRGIPSPGRCMNRAEHRRRRADARHRPDARPG